MYQKKPELEFTQHDSELLEIRSRALSQIEIFESCFKELKRSNSIDKTDTPLRAIERNLIINNAFYEVIQDYE